MQTHGTRLGDEGSHPREREPAVQRCVLEPRHELRLAPASANAVCTEQNAHLFARQLLLHARARERERHARCQARRARHRDEVRRLRVQHLVCGQRCAEREVDVDYASPVDDARHQQREPEREEPVLPRTQARRTATSPRSARREGGPGW